MNIISWLLFGLIAGIIANTIDPSPERGGLLGAVVLGVLGALLGGLLSNLIFGIGINGFNLPSLLIAVGGSLVVLFMSHAFESRV
jgi:uncharacterized membrane protein YeaQ/YmgE (transglycosylase-associated protein family)